MDYVKQMTSLRMDLARGACGWFSMKQERGGENTEYLGFETLAVQWDCFSKFALEALRILDNYLEGERLSQPLLVRAQIRKPFLAGLKSLLRKKTTLLRARTLWWNAAGKWEELNEDRHAAAEVYSEHSAWMVNLVTLAKTPECHQEHLNLLESKVDDIRKGEVEDAHDQLKNIEIEANTLVKKAGLNETLSEEWGLILTRANVLMGSIQTMKTAFPTRRRGCKTRTGSHRSGLTPTSKKRRSGDSSRQSTEERRSGRLRRLGQ